MLGGLEIKVTVDQYKMRDEITQKLGVTNVCTLCQFHEEPDCDMVEKKMCEICEDKKLWRISSDVITEIDETIFRNINVDY